MVRSISSVFAFWIAGVAMASGEEFSKEKVRRYSGYVELNAEVRNYIESLPPEAITDLVGELDLTRHKRWRNTAMFSLVLMKIKQLDENETDFNRDRVFGKLAGFVRILALDGYSGDAGSMLLRIGNSRMFHPAMVEVAKELAAGKDERNANRARWFLDEHEKWQRAEARNRERVRARDAE